MCMCERSVQSTKYSRLVKLSRPVICWWRNIYCTARTIRKYTQVCICSLSNHWMNTQISGKCVKFCENINIVLFSSINDSPWLLNIIKRYYLQNLITTPVKGSSQLWLMSNQTWNLKAATWNKNIFMKERKCNLTLFLTRSTNPMQEYSAVERFLPPSCFFIFCIFVTLKRFR